MAPNDDERMAPNGAHVMAPDEVRSQMPLFSGEKQADPVVDETTRSPAEKRVHHGPAKRAIRENKKPSAPREENHANRRKVRAANGSHPDGKMPPRVSAARPARKQARGLRCVAEIQMTPIKWIWTGRIAEGTLATLEGDPGLGKSTIVMDLIARVTQGEPLCGDAMNNPPANVILVSCEDSPGAVIAPRLAAAGAELQRVHLWPDLEPFTLPGSLSDLEQFIRQYKVRLVIVDPLMAVLSREVDAHKDQDIRRVLAEATSIAERTGAAILFVRHLNKRQGEPAIYRGGGSIGIIGAARSALLLARDPGDRDARILTVTKCNLGREAPSLRLRLVTAPPPAPGMDVATVKWEGECDLSADDLMTPPTEGRAIEDAKEMLRSVLRDGPVSARQIEKEAQAAGVSMRTLARAKKVLRLRSKRIGTEWFLGVPDRAPSSEEWEKCSREAGDTTTRGQAEVQTQGERAEAVGRPEHGEHDND